MFLTFDIETGPLPICQLSKLMPPFDESKFAPEAFDPSSVKYGNTKDEAKRAEKLQQAKEDWADREARKHRDRAEARVEHENAFIDKAALDALTGRVLCVCVRNIDGEYFVFDDEDESHLLAKAFPVLGGNHPLVGWNSKKFDLPFLLRRAMLLGVDFPSGWIDNRGFWLPRFVDLMEGWQLGDRRKYTKLNDVGVMMGLGGKEEGEVEGANFHKLWNEDREACLRYVRRDVELTYQVALRMAT